MILGIISSRIFIFKHIKKRKNVVPCTHYQSIAIHSYLVQKYIGKGKSGAQRIERDITKPRNSETKHRITETPKRNTETSEDFFSFFS